MKVIIDNVQYVPLAEQPENPLLLQALDIRFDSDAGDDITIRDYLRILLLTLWEEGEGFSGKRPFGNSGWEYDLYKPLIKEGFINGSLDEDGYIEKYDKKEAYAYVIDLINAAFNGVH